MKVILVVGKIDFTLFALYCIVIDISNTHLLNGGNDDD